MKIRYRIGKAPSPQPALGGSLQRPRPYLPVRLFAANLTVFLDGHLDTGADDTVFPEHVAHNLGIDLSKAQHYSINLAGRGPLQCRYAMVTLRITDGVLETYEWDAMVGFVPVPLKFPLLGFAGFFQFFDVDFHGGDLEVFITPHRNFPGRIF